MTILAPATILDCSPPPWPQWQPSCSFHTYRASTLFHIAAVTILKSYTSYGCLRKGLLCVLGTYTTDIFSRVIPRGTLCYRPTGQLFISTPMKSSAARYASPGRLLRPRHIDLLFLCYTPRPRLHHRAHVVLASRRFLLCCRTASHLKRYP